MDPLSSRVFTTIVLIRLIPEDQKHQPRCLRGWSQEALRSAISPLLEKGWALLQRFERGGREVGVMGKTSQSPEEGPREDGPGAHSLSIKSSDTRYPAFLELPVHMRNLGLGSRLSRKQRVSQGSGEVRFVGLWALGSSRLLVPLEESGTDPASWDRQTKKLPIRVR